MSRKRYRHVRCVATIVAWILLTNEALPSEIELRPPELYEGFDARKVVLEESGSRLALDPRALKFGKEPHGVVVTDPIDLGSRDGIVGLAGTIASVAIEVAANVPNGTTVEMETRHGTRRLDQSLWSPWRRSLSLRETVRVAGSRYLQLRITLQGAVPDKRPALLGIKLKPTRTAEAPWIGQLTIVRQDIQKIVRSPIAFHYERPDQEKIARFRRDAKLDEVVAEGRDDFEKLVRLLDWVGSGTNVRDGTGFEDKPYPWDVERVFEITPKRQFLVKGHCMSYAEILITAATALGYHARHWAIDGFRDMGHEVVEIWVPSLGKWVYFDPSLTTYYFDKETKAPLNVIEMHRIVAEKFLRDGEDMNWWCQGEKDDEATKARVREIGGRKHVSCRVGPYRYGKPMPRDYDWGWEHGYLAAGFVQLTPRNDFHSHPEKASRHFGAAGRMTADGYPFWVDEKTPPRKEENKEVNNWFTRPRDVYWTLDQATVELVKDKEGTLLVEFGHSMPFFRRYLVEIDGVEVKDVANPFRWKLKTGTNRLVAVPISEYDKRGLKSFVELNYAIPK